MPRKMHLTTDRQTACGARFVESTTSLKEVTCLACFEAQERARKAA